MIKETFEDIREKVLDWSFKKKLFDPEKQYMKFAEEVGEFEEAWEEYRKNPTPENKLPMMMEFGDVLVTLIILASQLRINPIECLNLAYFKIKDRKGRTINGMFYKQEDLEGVEDDL